MFHHHFCLRLPATFSQPCSNKYSQLCNVCQSFGILPRFRIKYGKGRLLLLGRMFVSDEKTQKTPSTVHTKSTQPPYVWSDSCQPPPLPTQCKHHVPSFFVEGSLNIYHSIWSNRVRSRRRADLAARRRHQRQRRHLCRHAPSLEPSTAPPTLTAATARVSNHTCTSKP